MDGTAFDPLLSVKWFPELLRIRTATGEAEPGAAPEAKPGAAPEAKPEEKPAASGEKKPAEVLPTLRGLELPRGNEKPVLVYFHWPHEDGARGKQVVKFCNGPLDDEAFVRVTSLFHCVEVNTRDSDVKLVEEAKVRTTPSILLCRADGAILWRTEDTALSGKGLAETVKRVLREKFPDQWAAVEKEVAEQKKNLSEARRLFAAGKDEEAMTFVNLVVGSEVRFTDAWAEGVKTLREEEKKAAEKAKAAK